jgi:acetyl-CoA carboxylase alpha subunit
VIDGIVPEPEGGAHTDHDAAATLLSEGLGAALEDAEGVDPGQRRAERRARFRTMGVFTG